MLQVTYVNKAIQIHGQGLCIVHRDTITVKPDRLKRLISLTSFECQFVMPNLNGSTKQVTYTNQETF